MSTMSEEKIRKAVKIMLEALGEDVNKNGLVETPGRVAKAWRELSRGGREYRDPVTTFPSAFTGVVLRRDIPFASVCEHHMLPYIGTVDYAYVPAGKVVGISKVVRLVRHYSAKLSMQEDLTLLLIQKMDQFIRPQGSAIRIVATHSCESMRGVVLHGSPTVTCMFSGCFENNASYQDQFFRLLGS